MGDMIMTEGDVQGVLYLCMMMLLYVILYFECLFVSSVCLLGCVFFLYWIIQIQYIWMETNRYADYTADEDINFILLMRILTRTKKLSDKVLFPRSYRILPYQMFLDRDTRYYELWKKKKNPSCYKDLETNNEHWQ